MGSKSRLKGANRPPQDPNAWIRAEIAAKAARRDEAAAVYHFCKVKVEQLEEKLRKLETANAQATPVAEETNNDP